MHERHPRVAFVHVRSKVKVRLNDSSGPDLFINSPSASFWAMPLPATDQ
jgi:hypothetical protein